MTRRYADDAEIGGRDPLDVSAIRAPHAWLPRLLRRLRTPAAFGLAPLLAPALFFVPLGFVLGPAGINFLNLSVLAHLDPVISIGLAALGVFVGLALGRGPVWHERLFAAASLESAVTIVVVTTTLFILLRAWSLPLAAPALLVALLMAVAAAASSGGYGDHTAGAAPSLAARVANLDDVLPIVVGGVTVAASQLDGLTAAIGLGLLTVLLGITAGVIGWLLIEGSHSVAERGVFLAGSLALAGGAAAYLDLSPLLAGLAAGVFWNWSPGRSDAVIRTNLSRYQHPLVVLMLLAAGAALQFSLPALWLLAPFVVFRLAGKLVGGWIASRLTPDVAPSDLGSYLLAPGLLGIAFALSAAQTLPEGGGVAVLTAVVLGTLASEIVALTVVPGEAPR
jgi:hypothetical protein